MYKPRYKTRYLEEVAPALTKDYDYSNTHEVPVIEKICLSQGIGEAVADKKLIDTAIDEMTRITGQRAVPTYSKKDISSFKLRRGMPIGVRVTLRGNNMFEFLDRLINVALPRTRDFRGVRSSGFDGRGNFTMGVREQIIFPEIDIEKTNRITGMDISIVTSAHTDEEAKALLTKFGFPFTDK